MPLHVDIRVNDDLIHSIHIGRIAGTTDPDSVNTYLAVLGDEPTKAQDWQEGTKFYHVYGDGALTCVERALYALTIGREDSQKDNESVAVLTEGEQK